MPSAELSRRVEKVVGYPSLAEITQVSAPPFSGPSRMLGPISNRRRPLSTA
jgi:hypothetical protein